MANELHVRMLNDGMADWNLWRDRHPEIIPDLEEADLNCKNLSNYNLNFANLRSAKLDRCIISNSMLKGVNFTNCNLTLSYLNGTNLSNCDFTNSILKYSNLSSSFISECVFTESLMVGIDFSASNIKKSNFEYASLNRAKFFSTKINSCKMTAAVIDDIHIDANTRFTDIHCDWIYIKNNERFPNEGKFLSTDDFLTIFEEKNKIIKLTVTHQFDIEIFRIVLKRINDYYRTNLKSLEIISNKNFVVFLNVTNKKIDHTGFNFLFSKYYNLAYQAESFFYEYIQSTESFSLKKNTNIIEGTYEDFFGDAQSFKNLTNILNFFIKDNEKNTPEFLTVEQFINMVFDFFEIIGENLELNQSIKDIFSYNDASTLKRLMNNPLKHIFIDIVNNYLIDGQNTNLEQKSINLSFE